MEGIEILKDMLSVRANYMANIGEKEKITIKRGYTDKIAKEGYDGPGIYRINFLAGGKMVQSIDKCAGDTIEKAGSNYIVLQKGMFNVALFWYEMLDFRQDVIRDKRIEEIFREASDGLSW
jgi:hypothetical protein